MAGPMNHIGRREFLWRTAALALPPAACCISSLASFGGESTPGVEQALRKDWLARWEKNIVKDARNRYCDTETGEEIGWLVSPFLNGFYYGYLATQDAKWADMLDGLGRCLDQAGREGAGRAHRLAEGRRRQHQLGARPLHRQPAGRGDGTAPRGPDGRCDLENAARSNRSTGRRPRNTSSWPNETFDKWDERGCWREVAGRRSLGRAAFRHRPADRQMDRRLRETEHRRLLAAGQQAELHRTLAAGHAPGDAEAPLPAAGRKVVAGDEVADAAARRGQVLRLELLGPGRPLGLQARRLAETLGGRASQRRLLCGRRGGHRGRLRARPGVRTRRTSSG